MSDKNPFLPEYEGLGELWLSLKSPNITDTAIAQLLQNSPNVWGVDVIDRRVKDLLKANFDLSDSGGSFFKHEQTWREWDKGISEVSVLSFWQNSGLLLNTAFPSGDAGTTARFDASLSLYAKPVAADIKTATTAASGSILDHVGPQLANWARDNKRIDTPEAEIHIEGSLDLRRLHPKWAQIQTQIRYGLANLNDNEFKISLKCPLPGDPNDPLDAGDLQVRVKLISATENPTHTWKTVASYKDMAGNICDPRVEFAKSLLESHANKKAKHVDDAGNHPLFIVAYHRRGRPGDVSPTHVLQAMQSASGPPNWMGVLFIDELVCPASKLFIPHTRALLPAEFNMQALKQKLEK